MSAEQLAAAMAGAEPSDQQGAPPASRPLVLDVRPADQFDMCRLPGMTGQCGVLECCQSLLLARSSILTCCCCSCCIRDGGPKMRRPPEPLRSAATAASGHTTLRCKRCAGSFNAPVEELHNRVEELKNMVLKGHGNTNGSCFQQHRPVVVVCRRGNDSQVRSFFGHCCWL